MDIQNFGQFWKSFGHFWKKCWKFWTTWTKCFLGPRIYDYLRPNFVTFRHILSLFDTFCHFWTHFVTFGYVLSLLDMFCHFWTHFVTLGPILAILDTFWNFSILNHPKLSAQELVKPSNTRMTTNYLRRQRHSEAAVAACCTRPEIQKQKPKIAVE